MKRTKPPIDTFFYILAIVFVLIAIMIIMTFRSIFGALSLASEIESTDTQSELKINIVKLEEAKQFLDDKETPIKVEPGSDAVIITPTLRPSVTGTL